MAAFQSYRDLTEQEIYAALGYLDANCSRDDWVRVGMAIKSELGHGGFALWDDWSKTGAKYNAKDARDTWKSIKPTGGITIATLIHEAQQFGFKLDEAKREPISQEQIEARRAKRKAEEEAAEAERNRKRAEAAEKAAEIWEAATDLEGDGHPYLERKGVLSFGLRVGTYRGQQNALLVPIRNVDGHLTSLQAIFSASHSDIGRDRDYLYNGQKRNCFHMIGGKPSGVQPIIAVTEGYSTGASIHMAKGCCVAVAFDAANVPNVARIMRETYPSATLLVCADNDQWNKDGNDGIHFAKQAASSAGGIMVVPKFADLSDKPTDFNDLHAREGIEAVREQITAAILTADNDNFIALDSNVNPFMFPHLSDRQQPLNTWENLAWMMGEYGITARYNVISKDVAVTIPGKHYGDDAAANCALAEINSLCARNRMPKADTSDYLKLIGTGNRFNPVAELIAAKPWDGVSRIKAICDTLETEPGYSRELLELLVRRWLISAVAAALLPSGFWSKGVLVLQGEQSLGKTAWFKSLVPQEQRKLIKVGANIDPTNKDSISSAIGHWMVELGELDGTFRKADIAKLKAFISSDIDMLRRPYDRLESTYQRRTVFFASVNPKHFLADDTGNVRWWTIPVVSVNYQHDIDVQQLWAEIASLFRDGERWWLEPEEEAQLEGVNREHEAVDPVEEMILAKFPWSDEPGQRVVQMTASQVLLSIGFDKPNRQQATHAATILRKLTGSEPRKTKAGRFFLVPQDREQPF